MRLKSQCFSSPRYLSQCTMHLAKNKNTSVEEMVNQPFFNNLGQIFQEFSRAKLKKQQHFCLGVGWIRLILPFLHHIASSAVAVQVIHNCFMLRMVSPPKKRPISIPSQILEYPYKKLIFPKGIFFSKKHNIDCKNIRRDFHPLLGHTCWCRVCIYCVYICQGLGWSSHLC